MTFGLAAAGVDPGWGDRARKRRGRLAGWPRVCGTARASESEEDLQFVVGRGTQWVSESIPMLAWAGLEHAIFRF